MKKIKIMYFVAGLKSGGVEQMLVNYCSKMDKQRFEFVVVYQHEPVQACLDKITQAGCSTVRITARCDNFLKSVWDTYKVINEYDFHAPMSFLDMNEVIEKISEGKLSYPIVVKPRYGCGSISVAIAYDEEDLRYLTKKANEDIANSYLKYESSVTTDKVIYQECLKGQEYGADIINDLTGKTQNVIVRKKLAMRSGETDIAQLVDEQNIKETLVRLGKTTKHIANMDCDIFMVNGIPYILEMNARFGGGYPFSHMGGCNLPKAIVEWAKGKTVDKDTISARTGITGYKEIYITEI